MEMNRSIMSIKEIPDWLIRKRKGEEMVGEVLIPGVLNPGDIAKTDGCRQAAALADRI